nr:MAG TPA: Helix-turn-helix of insertion element transposase [Caudoviricetes sp.]
MANFNEKQLLAIELLARAEYEGMTQQQIADEVGVDARTIRRWNQDKRFKNAVGRKSMELITELSPVIFKTTAEFLQSKDQRVQAKGVDVFLKASATIEAKNKEEEQNNKEFDVDAWLIENCPTVETAKNKEQFLKKEIKELKEILKSNVTAILLSEYQLKLVTEGCSIDEVTYLSSKFNTSPEDEYRLLSELYKFPEVVKGVQTGEESGAWED